MSMETLGMQFILGLFWVWLLGFVLLLKYDWPYLAFGIGLVYLGIAITLLLGLTLEAFGVL